MITLPIHKMTGSARRAVSLANAQIESKDVSQIGTEHLLLGLLGETEGIAFEALSSLGVSYDGARQVIGQLRNGEEPVDGGAETRRAMRFAATEAERRGDTRVGTDHLLIGILKDGGGLGAKALHELGISAEALAPPLERCRSARAEEAPESRAPRDRPAISPEMDCLLAAAEEVGFEEGAPWLRADHLLRAMLADDQVSHVLGRLGLDLVAARSALAPPQDLLDIQSGLGRLRTAKQQAVVAQDFELASQLRDDERHAALQYFATLEQWLRHLG